MNSKDKLIEQLSAKLYKRALELDRDAARLNGINNPYAVGLRHVADDLKAISEKLKI